MSFLGKFKDVTGQKFNNLTAIKRIGFNKSGKTAWLFRCDCGVEKEIGLAQVIAGRTKSCGCLKNDRISKLTFSHGDSRTRLYRIFHDMHSRCMNKKNSGYKNYGGRGIKICEQWRDFTVFRSWALENEYTDNLTIDRIDNNGDYSPENVKWANKTEQGRNKRNVIWYEIGGVRKPLIEWCEIFNIDYDFAYQRNKRGLPPFIRTYKKSVNL
jgi:hypothetical protein